MNEKVTLKQNYPFFSKLQGKKGITGKNHFNFYIYKHFEVHEERIILKPEILENIP